MIYVQKIWFKFVPLELLLTSHSVVSLIPKTEHGGQMNVRHKDGNICI